jgi:hypothetical protein
VLNLNMPSVMLSVIMPSVIVLNVSMPSVIMPSVLAPPGRNSLNRISQCTQKNASPTHK